MLKVIKSNSELHLIAALKRGEEHAYTEVLNIHKQQIAITVIGMLGAIPEAEDVGQEVFIRFFRNIENFKKLIQKNFFSEVLTGIQSALVI